MATVERTLPGASDRAVLSPQSSPTTTNGASAATTPTTATGVASTTPARNANTSSTANPAAAQTNANAEGASAAQTDPLGTSASTAFTSPSATSSPSDNDDGNALQQASGGGSRGMSSGTKIGIGVGVGVGLAVAVGLLALFFIMRKRRRSRYGADGSAEKIRGQPAMISTEPALGAAAALGRSPSYRSNTRSSYLSLSPTGPPPLPETLADPTPEATSGTIPAQPTIVLPSQQSLPHDPEAQTPRSRRSLEAEVISPGNESLFTPAPPYNEAPSPINEQPSRSISPVSPVSSMGSRPPSLRRSFDGHN